MSNTRNELFSLLRMACVLCIVGYHFAPSPAKSQLWALSSGQTIVTFFFVLSGFLIHSRNREWWGGWRVFAAAKARALLPIYYSVFLFCLAIEFRNGRFPFQDILSSAFLLQAWVPGAQLSINGPAWFLSALVACYLFYAALRPLVPHGWTSVVAFAFWVLSCGALFAFGGVADPEFTGYALYCPLFHFGSFCVGVALAGMTSFTACLERLPASVLLGLLILSGVVVCAALAGLPSLPPVARFAASVSLYAPVFGLLILSTAVQPAQITAIFDRHWIGLLGAISYPVYLLQAPVFKVFDRLVLDGNHATSWTTFVIYVALLLVVSTLWLSMVAIIPKRATWLKAR